MRKLPKTASTHARFVYGQYPIRRLVRMGLDELASVLTLANDSLREAARLVEDLESPVQHATADRDEVDDNLDEIARLSRLQLGARSTTATREPPYILIYPNGITPYVAARLGEQTLRYGELADRLERYLRPNDPVRVEAVAKLHVQLAAWKVAVQGLEDANNDLALARTSRDLAVMAWETTIEQTYGALVSKLGKAKAERFFPKTKRKEEPAPEPGTALLVPEPSE